MQFKTMSENSFLDRIIDKIFDIKKSTFYLIIILLLGFILRFIAAINLTVGADDMHFVTHAINFFSSGKLVTYDQSSGLWFLFTDIMYKILGVTQIGSRMAALIFGSASILIIYLLTKEFFEEKKAITAAFLLAIAPFHVKNTLAEMDAMAIFFVLFMMLFFIRALKTSKNFYYLASGLFFGLAIYTKVYPLLFIPSMLIFFIYWKRKEKKKIITKDNMGKILVFLFAAFIFTIPALTHNYLLYKEKGFMDLQFTRTLGLGKNISEQYYGWDYQFNAKNDWRGSILGNSAHSAATQPTIISAFEFIFKGDPINFLLGTLGILMILAYRKENRNYLVFFILSILFVMPFLASIILLPKHYIFLEILLIPAAALALSELNLKISKKFNRNISIYSVILLFLAALLYLGATPQLSLSANHFYGKSHIAQIMEFKEEAIPKDALIIADSRIYRGRINWAFYGRPYFEGTDFLSLLSQMESLPGKEITVDTYFFECIKDDCGWGTVKNQPEFNTSMEQLTSFFSSGGKILKKISEPYEEKPYFPLLVGEKEDIINIYYGKIKIKDSAFLLASQPKNWFLYDIGYEPKENQFDYYEAKGPNIILNKLAHIIAFLALIIALLSPIYAFYLIFKNENFNNSSSI